MVGGHTHTLHAPWLLLMVDNRGQRNHAPRPWRVAVRYSQVNANVHGRHARCVHHSTHMSIVARVHPGCGRVSGSPPPPSTPTTAHPQHNTPPHARTHAFAYTRAREHTQSSRRAQSRISCRSCMRTLRYRHTLPEDIVALECAIPVADCRTMQSDTHANAHAQIRV